MNISQAMHILGVTSLDDARTIKSKYHRLMAQHHPDAHRSEDPELLIRAQLINEAYRLVRSSASLSSALEEADEKENPLWHAPPCEGLYTSRDIYMIYDIYGDTYESTAAHGKYLWDPEAEEFSLYIRSINQLCTHLMSLILEERSLSEKNIPETLRFLHHKQLFHALAGHFMDPCDCLPKLVSPQRTDSEGRSIYRFRAHLGALRSDAHYPALSLLQKGDQLFPQSLEDNRLVVCTQKKASLGHLSLEKDSYYLCLIPLLRSRQAQLKMTVRDITPLRGGSALDLRVSVDLRIRTAASPLPKDLAGECAQIRTLLEKWRQAPVS